MSLSDAAVVGNLMKDTDVSQHMLNEASWSYITDINNGNYQDRIVFNTTTLKQQLIDYHSAFLVIPMTIFNSAFNVGTADTYKQSTLGDANKTLGNPINHSVPLRSDDTLLCLRDSILNLICGLIVQTDSGQTIVNETGRLSFINNLRLKIEHSIDWAETFGSMLHFSMDTQATCSATGNGAAPVATASAALGGVVPNQNNWVSEFLGDTLLPASGTAAPYTAEVAGTATAAGRPAMAVRNPLFNAGCLKRVQFFQQACSFTALSGTATAANFQLVAKIPLRLLHDFFEQLDFPIINLGFTFQFALQQYHYSTNTTYTTPTATVPTYYGGIPPLQYAVVTSGGNILPTSSALGLPPPPQIAYGTAISSQTGVGSGCRLYYRSVKLSPSDNQAFADRLKRGFTKKIKFMSTDNFQPSAQIAAGSSNSLVIAPSIVAPVRVWALLYRTGALTGGVGTYAANNGLQVVHGTMKNANILINNQQYYKNNLQTVDDFWLQLREQFNPTTGSMITYQDFVSRYRYHCFDLQRLSERLPSKTEPVALVLNFERDDAYGGACDLICLIERMNQAQFDFSASDVNITVGSATS